jgi:hypothetical protein
MATEEETAQAILDAIKSLADEVPNIDRSTNLERVAAAVDALSHAWANIVGARGGTDIA